MLLAVAGLNDEEIEKRTDRLASGAWSEFPPAERQAFAFAYRLTKAPWEVNRADVQGLVEAFGPERAADVVWYTAWCNYMTRVADAFQLPLERENVFLCRDEPAGPKGGE
jgi:hypothetical protein